MMSFFVLLSVMVDYSWNVRCAALKSEAEKAAIDQP